MIIQPAVPAEPAEVAHHYDELDGFYRSLWGEHVHHGLWRPGDDPHDVDAATLRLMEMAASGLDLQEGARLVDIGCGYGGTARWFAREFGVAVTGVTLSAEQLARARDFPPPARGSVELRRMDWLANDFPDGHFDAAVAIESLAHMPDKPAFFRQLARTLKPGGRASLCCWLAAADANRLERHHLRKICEEGRLPSLPSLDAYLEMVATAGLTVLRHEDLTRGVARTWTVILWRMVRGFLSDRRYLRFVASRLFRERVFALTVPRMMLMFGSGGIRYGWLVLEKPDA